MTKGMWSAGVVSIMVYVRNDELPEDQNLKEMLEKPAWQVAEITVSPSVHTGGITGSVGDKGVSG